MPLAAAAVAQTANEDARLDAYVRARVGTTIGDPTVALPGYHAALAAGPANLVVAENALDQALLSGDEDLAVRSAQVLHDAGTVSAEVRLTLLADAVQQKDWTQAERQVAALGRDGTYSFLAPVMGAWVALGSRRDDPLELLAKAADGSLGGLYAAEHRPLLLLAMGKDKQGLVALRARLDARDGRSDRLRTAAAARLARQGKRRDAMELLAGQDRDLAAARIWLDQRRSLPGEIATPSDGLAELFLRLAIDLDRQDVDGVPLIFARISTFLAPDYSEAWLVTSKLLAQQGLSTAALEALRNIADEDPAASQVSDARVALRAETGDTNGALAEARAAASGSGATSNDWVRLGDVYAQLDRHRDAADAFDRALRAYGASAPTRPEWTIWLQKAAALDKADRWPEAKAALEAAHKLAPREPLVLNYLGYSQLERRENIVEAELLIRQARGLRPDNPQITDSLGWARYLQGDAAGAIRLLERALSNEPGDGAINEHLGDAYYSIGRRYEARYAWQAALIGADGKDAQRLRAKIDLGLTPETASP
jgi:Flp pilus assembly protein TadD